MPNWCQLPSHRDLHFIHTILCTPSRQSTQMAYRCISLPLEMKQVHQYPLSSSCIKALQSSVFLITLQHNWTAPAPLEESQKLHGVIFEWICFVSDVVFSRTMTQFVSFNHYEMTLFSDFWLFSKPKLSISEHFIIMCKVDNLQMELPSLQHCPSQWVRWTLTSGPWPVCSP